LRNDLSFIAPVSGFGSGAWDYTPLVGTVPDGLRAGTARGILKPTWEIAGVILMSAYELFVLAVAGANGGFFYWVISRRQRVFAWIKAKRRR